MKQLRTLFTAPPQFTIDTCSFNEMFDPERDSNKKNFPDIWNGIEEMLLSGEIISHLETYQEIMDGPYDELVRWAKQNRSVFRPYDFEKEGGIIAEVGRKGFITFIHQRKPRLNADPWLLAQAKLRNIRIITQEKGKKPPDLPRICDEFGVRYLNIAALVREKGWVFTKP